MNKRYLYLGIILVFVVGSIWYLESQKVHPVEEVIEEKMPDPVEITNGSVAVNETVEVPEPVFVPNPVKEGRYQRAPELVGTQGWINSEPLKLADLRGKVVLVDFWTYSCINCIRTFPFLRDWWSKYQDKGLVIVGVHTPEFNFEEKYTNVVEATQRESLTWPIAQDNNYATWRAYKNRFWPRKYLIDSEGYIRYDHIGEGAYEETEAKIQELLEEIGSEVSGFELVKDVQKDYMPRTEELYAGYDFALSRDQNIGNPEGLQPDKIIDYTVVENPMANKLYLYGRWRSNENDLETTSNEEASMYLIYTAKSVNFVADGTLEMEVLIGGEPISKEMAGNDVVYRDGKSLIDISGPRLYNVVEGDYGSHLLQLVSNSEGLKINSFTFG